MVSVCRSNSKSKAKVEVESLFAAKNVNSQLFRDLSVASEANILGRLIDVGRHVNC